MNTGLHRRVAVAVLLAVLLPSVEVEAVAAQGAFRRIKRGAKRVTRTRDVVNTARDAVSPSSRGVDTSVEETPSAPVASYGSEDVDRQIAATFAPVFYQGLVLRFINTCGVRQHVLSIANLVTARTTVRVL